MFFGQIFKARCVQLKSGVVDEDVQPAEFLYSLSNDRIAKLWVGYVSSHHQTSASLPLDCGLGDLRIGSFIEMGNGNIGAFAREQDCNRAANA